MDQSRYRETIQKLLALSDSPNENEAKAALLKAQELMAKYKISQWELSAGRYHDKEKVITLDTQVTYTGNRDPWIQKMAQVISNNYGCEWYSSYRSGRATHTIHLMGMESDMKVCESAFRFAISHVQSRYETFRKLYKGTGVRNIRQEYYSYAYGFIEGLEEAYLRQVQENRYELAVLVPQAVQDEINSMEFSDAPFYVGYAAERFSDSFAQGVVDGMEYGSVKKLDQ